MDIDGGNEGDSKDIKGEEIPDELPEYKNSESQGFLKWATTESKETKRRFWEMYYYAQILEVS